MSIFTRSQRTARRAAVLAAIGFASIALFELALVAGAPWGHAAWGGAHAHLSTALRIGSVGSFLVLLTAALIVLGRAGFWGPAKLAAFFYWGTWALAALSTIGALMNLASRSHYENAIFGPTALILAILCTIVARSAGHREPRQHKTRPAPA
jgi:hypothetical protein